MKRLLKSGIGAICAVAMAATGLGAVANSAYADVTDLKTITIENISPGDTFVAYRLLDLTDQYDSSTPGSTYGYGASTSPNKDAYIDAMIASGEYDPALATTDEDEKIEAITTYITSRLEDTISQTSSTDTRLRTYGNAVYAQLAALDPAITPDAQNGTEGTESVTDSNNVTTTINTYTFNNVVQGYWLIVQTNVETCSSHSYVMIGTVDEDGLTIQKKIPEVVSYLKVKDANLSTDDVSKGSTSMEPSSYNHDFNVVKSINVSSTDCSITIEEADNAGSDDNYSGWQDSADYSHYSKTGGGYDTKGFDNASRMIMPVSLSAVVQRDDAADILTFHVKLPVGVWVWGIDQLGDAISRFRMSIDGEILNEEYWSLETNNNRYQNTGDLSELIATIDLSALPSENAPVSGSVISFSFLEGMGGTAPVDGVVPQTGYVEILNANTGASDLTPEDLIKIFAYRLQVNKVNDQNEKLSGAVFKLEQFIAGVGSDTYKGVTGDWKVTFVGDNRTVDATTGSVTFTSIGDGYYRLTEVTAPDGYNAIEPQYFEISAEHEVLSDDPQLTALTATGETLAVEGSSTMTNNFILSDGNLETRTLTTNIVNRKGTALPSTGGMGTFLLYTVGGLMILITMMGIAYTLRRQQQD